MTEEMDPLAKAKANGFVEPAPPSHEQRVKDLVAAFEHAKASNAPIPDALLIELKALLGHEDPPVVEGEKPAAAPAASASA